MQHPSSATVELQFVDKVHYPSVCTNSNLITDRPASQQQQEFCIRGEAILYA